MENKQLKFVIGLLVANTTNVKPPVEEVKDSNLGPKAEEQNDNSEPNLPSSSHNKRHICRHARNAQLRKQKPLTIKNECKANKYLRKIAKIEKKKLKLFKDELEDKKRFRRLVLKIEVEKLRIMKNDIENETESLTE